MVYKLKTQIKPSYIFPSFILICCLLYASSARALPEPRIETFDIFSDLNQQEAILQFVDQDTIVLLEIDDVITIPKARMFAPGSFYRNFIFDLINESYDKPHYKQAAIHWLKKRDVMLTKESWPWLMNQLLSRASSVYGLYNLGLYFPAIEEMRYQELRNLLIGFSEKIDDSDMFFVNRAQDGSKAMFYKGIIFTENNSGLYMVQDFFMTIKNIPLKLLVISKDVEAMKILAENMSKIYVKFYGLVYKPSYPDLSDLRPDVIALQQQSLIYHNTWLEDEDAIRLLQNKRKPQTDSLKR
jgi:hypothetical protein